MSDERRERASDLLWQAWSAGTRLRELDAAIRPSTREDGYRVQALLEPRSARPLFGWKIAATSRAGQAHINVDGPLAGRLLAERVFDSAATVPFGANHMRVAEAEFAFRMGRDCAPRGHVYDVSEVMAAVAALHPAIEIPDSRYDDFTIVGAPQLIADNACAHYFVLGHAASDDWRSLDLAAHPVVARVEGQPPRHGSGSLVLGDPRVALTWLVNEIVGLGETVRAGQVVTTGTCVTPLPIARGDHVIADFGTLGIVEARLAAD